MKALAIVCDLDGTLYNAAARQDRHLRGARKDFEGFHADAKFDKPHYWCLELLQAMRCKGFRVVFTSGRDEKWRGETEIWLREQLHWKPEDYELHMRPDKDFTADDAMKQSWLLDRIWPNYNVLFAIDDRKRVADMWRRNGITCLHCAEGNF